MIAEPAEQRIRAIKLFKDNVTQTRIGAVLGVSQSTVHNWLKREGLTRTKNVVMPTTDPTDHDSGRYRIVHPTVNHWMSTRIPAHELEEIQ